MAYAIIIVIAIVCCIICYTVGYRDGCNTEREKAKINEVHRRIAEQQKKMLHDAEEAQKQPVTETSPAPAAPPPIETEAKKPDDSPMDDRTLIGQARAAGFRCELVDADKFNLVMSEDHSFRKYDDEDDGAFCTVCGATEPYAVWGTSKTNEKGLVGYFCRKCGSGFVMEYPGEDGNVHSHSKALFQLLDECTKGVTTHFVPFKKEEAAAAAAVVNDDAPTSADS